MSVLTPKNDISQCNTCGYHVVDRAHIVSRGAGGSNEPYNIMLLCRKCHSNQHFIGWPEFIRRNELEDDMLKRGFELCRIRGKWFVPKKG